MSRVSIIIPMYNEARHIGRTLLAALEAARQARLDCELIVVDNGSDDHGPRIARQVVGEARARSQHVPGSRFHSWKRSGGAEGSLYFRLIRHPGVIAIPPESEIECEA